MQLDTGLRIIFANEPFLKMLGVPSAELLGKNIEYTAAATIFDNVLENFISQLKNGVQGKEWRSTLMLNNGERIFSCHISPIVFNDGRKGVSVLLEDVTEMRKKERELRESEERFRKLVEISPDAVILHREGKIIYTNPAARKLFGASDPGEITGRFVLDFVDLGFRGLIKENIRKDLDGELSPLMELPVLRLDGTPVIVEGRGVKTSIDGLPAVMVTLQDITDRKQAQEKLKESERKYRFLAENSLDIINRQTAENICTYVSPAVTLVLGYPEEELLGRPLLELVHPDDLDRVLQELRHTIEKSINKVTLTFRLRHREGHYLWFESTANIIRDKKSGKILELFSISRDITERKNLEDELNATAERYKQLAECSLDALVITDLRGDVITTNKAALALVELEDTTEVQGTSVFRFLAPESRERAKHDFAAMSPSRKAVMQTYAGITARGNHITVEAIGNPITYKGSPANIISIREISKRTVPGKASKQTSRCSG